LTLRLVDTIRYDTKKTQYVMKTYQLGEDKVVNVKQELGELKVTIENTDSKSKFMEFTPNRYNVAFYRVDNFSMLVIVLKLNVV